MTGGGDRGVQGQVLQVLVVLPVPVVRSTTSTVMTNYVVYEGRLHRRRNRDDGSGIICTSADQTEEKSKISKEVPTRAEGWCIKKKLKKATT